jgi:NAD(P)-dependent dehydrogenase (short-subunit alcohol dehydrogenase family)
MAASASGAPIDAPDKTTTTPWRGAAAMKAAALFAVEGLATVITGGASGIGLAYGEAMADNGARVTLLDIDAAALAEAVDRLRRSGGDVEGRRVDVTDRPALYRAFDRFVEDYGRLDVVFANAGIDPCPGFLAQDGGRDPAGAIEAIDGAVWDRAIAINLTAVFATIKAAAGPMKRQGGGKIIVTTSVAASKVGGGVGTPYMPAKAGAAHLVRRAALELARFNIQVNAIAPGPFATNIAGGQMQDPAARARFSRFVPLRRVAETSEIQGAALFLASRASAYVTGAEIVVDGGRLLGSAD